MKKDLAFNLFTINHPHLNQATTKEGLATPTTIKNSKEGEQLRQRNKDSFQNAALYWNKLANERVFEIGKQLLAIAFIILPLTGSIVFSNKVISPFNFYLLVLGWILLFSSIISGFVNFWTEAKYFNYLSNDSSTREQIWSNSNKLVSKMDEETNRLGATKPASSLCPLIIQGGALLLGVLLIMIVVCSLLTQNTNIDPNNKYDHHFPRIDLRGNNYRGSW